MARRVSARLGNDDVRFVWVGRAEAADLAEAEARHGSVPQAAFVGAMPSPLPMVAGFAVFVHTARHDSFPLAVLEAIALGRPVVAFAQGGLPEQLGDAGVLVPDGDDAMAEAVVGLLGDPARCAELGSRGRDRVRQQFGVEAFARGVSEVVAESGLMPRPPMVDRAMGHTEADESGDAGRQ